MATHATSLDDSAVTELEAEFRGAVLRPDDDYERLREVEAKYDPDTLFHVNQNVEPAA